MLYDIHDSSDASNTPSLWGFTNTNLNGHENAITQNSPVNNVDFNNTIIGAASMLLLKFKVFYDFKAHFSWMTRSEGFSGMVFRFTDY